MKFGSENVALANMFNIKEDRQLEKTLATIQLEREYALKLLELSNRQATINSRRLKARVNRTQSHLSVDDIQQLKTLEMEGKLKPLYTSVEADGSKRIAIAARRLGIKSAAVIQKETPSPHAKRKELLAMTMRELRQKQGKVPPEETDGAKVASPRDSDDSLERAPPKSPPPCGSSVRKKVRSHSSVVRPSSSQIERGRVRPASTTGYGPSDRRSMSPSPSRAGTSLGFSSHDSRYTQDTSGTSPPGACLTERRLSTVSMSSVAIADTFMKNMIAERRQEMLDFEHVNTQDLQEKQRHFLNQVDGWVRENPSVEDASEPASIPRPRSRPKQKRHLRFIRRDSERELNRATTDEDWKELHKCRYLRIAEELVDLSGVVTLARDQMKVFNSLRQAREESDSDE